MFSLDQRMIKYFDWINFSITVAISCIGLLFVFSATYSPEHTFSSFFIKQALGLCAGILIYFLSCFADYRSLLRWSFFGYLGVICLLLFTLVKGSVGMGAQRWINLGFIKLQPSELAKLLFPAFAVHYLYTQKDPYNKSFSTFIPIIIMLGFSFLLILKQPDLGTALIVVFVGFFMLWFAGITKKFFLIGFLICTVATPILWKILKPYQKKRIEVFLGYGNSHKERYQIEQATIAVGSGGIWGKGLLRGTQNKLRFLPECRTDFIFAVLCEEWGLLGALMVLALFFILFMRLCKAANTLHDPAIQLFALGSVLHILFSTIINVCMVLGLLPIVGIPLPLMSYGISNLWITFASFGWFARIIMQQRQLEQYFSPAIHYKKKIIKVAIKSPHPRINQDHM